MAKSIVRMKCDKPGCDHPHDIEVDLPEPKTINGTITQIPQVTGNQAQVMSQIAPQTAQIPENKPKKLTHEELSEFIPKGVNAMSCPGGDCGHQKIKNPKQTRKFKTCPNGDCGANTVPKGSDFCPYCTKSIDEDEELEDGVDLGEDDE